MKQIYLVGTIHIDPFGPARLDHILNRLSPRIIGVELSEDRVHQIHEKKTNEEKEEMLEWLIQEGNLSLTPYQRETYLKICDHQEKILMFEAKRPFAYAQAHLECQTELIDASVFTHGEECFMKGQDELTRDVPRTSQERKNFTQFLKQGFDAYLAALDKSCGYLYLEIAQHQQLFRADYDEKQIQDLIASTRRRNTQNLAQLSESARKAQEAISSPKRDETMAANLRRLYEGLDEGIIVAPVGSAHLLPLRYALRDLELKYMTLAQYGCV